MAPSRNKNNSDKNKMAPASSSITESDSAAAVAEAPTLRPRRAIIVYNERQLQARANEERRLSKGGGSAISSSSCILPTDLSSESANEVEGRTPRKRCSSTSEDSAKNSKRLRPKLGQNEEELKEKVDNKFSLPRRSTRSTTSACMLQSEKQKQKAAKTDDKADDKAFAKLSTIATSSISTSTFSIAQLTRSNKSSKNETCDTTSTSLTSSVSVKNATSSASCNNKKSSTDATETTVSRNGAPSIYDTTVESVIETLRKESRSPSSSVISSNAASSRNTPQPSLSSSYNVPPSTTVAEALLYQSGGGSHSIFSGSSSAGKTNSQLIQSILQSAAASAALAIGDESIIPSSSAINATFSSVLNSMRNSRLRREMEAPIRYAMGGGGRRTKGPVTSLYTASIPAVNVTDAELFRPSWSMPDLAVVSRVTADIMQLGRAIFHDSSWARIKFPERSLFGQEAIVYHYRSVRWTDRHMMFVPYGKPRINEDIPYTCSDCFKFMQCLKHRFTEAQQRNKIPVLIVRYGRFLDDPDYPAVKHICDPDELTDMEKEALREYGESLRACSTERLSSERREEVDVPSAGNSNRDRTSNRNNDGLKVVVPVNRTLILPFLADVQSNSIKQLLAKERDAVAELLKECSGYSDGGYRRTSSPEKSELLFTLLKTKSNWNSAWALFAGSLSGKCADNPSSVSYRIRRPPVKRRTKRNTGSKVATLEKTVPKSKSPPLNSNKKSLAKEPESERKFVINTKEGLTKKNLRSTNVPILKRRNKEFHNQQQSSASASSPLTAEQNEEKSEKEYRRLLLMLEAQLTACCAKMINAGLDFTSDTLRRKSGELSEDLGIPASRISDEWLTMIGRRLGVSTSFASDYLRDDRFASSAMDIAADEVEEEVDNKAWNANDYLLNIISAAMDSSSGGGAAVDNDNLTTTPDGGVKTELTDTTSMCVEEEVPQLLKATTNEETARTFSGNNSDDTSMLPAEGHCSPSTSDAAVVSGSMESVSVLVSESALPIQLFTSTPPIVEDGVIASGSGEEFLQRMEASLSSGVESSLQREIKREVLDEEFVVSRANPSVDSIGGNNDCASSNVVDHSTLNQPSTSNEASTTTDASTMSHSASTNITNNSSVNISSPATMRSVYDLIVSAAAAASRANKLAMKRKKMANGVVVGGRRKSLTLSSPSSPSVLTKPTGSTTNDVDKCKSLSPLTVVCDTTACASQPSSCRSSPALTLANGAVGKRNGVAGKVANGTVQSSNGGVSASVMALLMNGGYEDGCCTEQPQNGMTVGAANTTLTAEKNNNNTKNTLFSMLQANFTNFNHPEVAIALETIRRHIETRDHSLMPMFNTFSARITKMMYTTLPKAAHNGVRGDDGMKSDGGEGNALTA